MRRLARLLRQRVGCFAGFAQLQGCSQRQPLLQGHSDFWFSVVI